MGGKLTIIGVPSTVTRFNGKYISGGGKKRVKENIIESLLTYLIVLESSEIERGYLGNT